MVLKLHMPPDEARRHVLKRQQADWSSVLRQRNGVDLPSWVSTRSPGCSVSMARSPSGVRIVVPVAKQLNTCAEVSMNPVEAPPPVKGARSNASF